GGQNAWSLSTIASNSRTVLARGGTFVPATWYAVQGRIGGASHSLAINGATVFAASDSTFLSGTLGFMSWGNAVSWVSAMRWRKYAAVEPSTTVGSEQTGGSASASLTSLALNPTSVVGGNASSGTLTMSTTLGGSVMLTSSNPSVASVPGSILVPAGSSSANFTVTTGMVSTPA